MPDTGNPDSLYDVLTALVLAIDHAGWPAVVALIIVTGGVVIAALWAAPRVANAWAIARSGATDRERALERKLVGLEAEMKAMRHQLEEQATVLRAIAPHVDPTQLDPDLLGRLFGGPTGIPQPAIV